MQEILSALMHLNPRHNKHFWRDIKFSELSELYISMSLKTLSLSLVGIFVPVFLLQHGNTILEIVIYFLMVYSVRLVGHIIFGYLTALKGPKHVIRYSYILLLVLLIGLFTYPEQSWSLWGLAIIHGLHLGAFFTGYHVDFSKIRSSAHAGAQVGKMMIYLKIFSGIGPVLGGLVATVWGIEWTIGAAIIILLVATIPLFTSGEPVKIKQKLNWSELFSQKLSRSYISTAGFGLSQSSNIVLWPLLLGAFIFSDSVYANIGAVTSIGFIASILASHAVGKIVDSKNGVRNLFESAQLLTAANHVLMVFAGSTGGVVAINVLGELGTIGGHIPFFKGYYGLLDEQKGQRIATVVVIELFNTLGRIVLMLALIIAIPFLGDRQAIYIGFLLGAVGALMMTAQNFKVLKT